jgi:serine/threonine protein kinase
VAAAAVRTTAARRKGGDAWGERRWPGQSRQNESVFREQNLPSPLTPGVRIGPYEVLAPLGSGGMGEVWRARDTHLGRDVALKSLPEGFEHDPGRVDRLEREARLLASLQNANVATLYGFEVVDRSILYVTASGPTRVPLVIRAEGVALAAAQR